MQETKETSSDQTSAIQEMTCRHQEKQHTRCIAFEEILYGLLSRTTFALASRRDFSRRKQNKGVRVSFIQHDISRRKQNRSVRVS